MPLPERKLLLDLLESYKLDREDLHESPAEKVINLGETVYSLFTKRIPTHAHLNKICELVANRLKNDKDGNSADDWLDIAIFLGNKAAEAQSLKKLSCCNQQACDCPHEASGLCQTLHAIRNKIVRDIIGEFNDKYDCKITRLWESVTDLDVKIKTSTGDYYKAYNTDLETKLLELAFLENKEGIIRARQSHLLDHLKNLSSANVQYFQDIGFKKLNTAFPCCLQEEFYAIFCSIVLPQLQKNDKNVSFLRYSASTL